MKIEALEIKDLTFGFGSNTLFSHVSCKFNLGEVLRIKGAAGTGKSCLLKVLAGLLAPSSGEYCINGAAVHEMSFEEFTPYRLAIGYSFEYGGLLSNRTLRENLALPLEYHRKGSRDEIAAKVEMILKAFHLVKAADLRPSAVSGGQRKAACVARAFMLNPSLLVLDDPTMGLGDAALVTLEALVTAGLQSGEINFVVTCSDDRDFLSGLPVREIDLGASNLQGVEVAA